MSDGPDLVASVETTIEAMHWLTPADQAACDLALAYAHQIMEAAVSDDERFRTKMLGWVGPHLLHTLKSLGGTPVERKNLKVQADVKSSLALLREKHGA